MIHSWLFQNLTVAVSFLWRLLVFYCFLEQAPFFISSVIHTFPVLFIQLHCLPIKFRCWLPFSISWIIEAYVLSILETGFSPLFVMQQLAPWFIHTWNTGLVHAILTDQFQAQLSLKHIFIVHTCLSYSDDRVIKENPSAKCQKLYFHPEAQHLIFLLFHNYKR